MSDDVLIRIRTALEKGGITAAEAELKKLEGAARGAAVQTTKVEGAFSSFASSVATSNIGQTIAGYFAVRSIVNFTQAITDAELQYQKTTRSLQFATGSAAAAGEAYQFARTEASRLGLEIAGVAEQYALFSAGAKGSAIAGEDVKKVFTGVISASRALGLATTDTERAFRALSQIIGKGKVTAEEFRGQIGDALPAATFIGAKALGVAKEEFSRLLDAGELTIDFLPKFGKALTDAFGTTAEKASGDLQSSINRVSNSYNDLKLAIADTQAFQAGIGALGSLAGAIDTVTKALKDAKSSGSPFLPMPAIREDTVNDRRAAFDKLIAGIKEREDLASAIRDDVAKAPPFSPNQTKALTDATESLKEQARAADAQREALKLSNAEAVRTVSVQKAIAHAIADGAPVTRGLIENATAAADAESKLTVAQEAKAKSISAGNKAASEAAAEVKRQANAAREFSESLAKQITVSDAQAEALNRGGQAGARYQVVQTQIAQAIASGVPVTSALRAEIDRFADSQTRLAGIRFAEQLNLQTAEVNTQREALNAGGAEGERFRVVQEEINKAIAAGAEVTPALRAEIEKYAGSLALLSSDQFAKSIKDQTEAIAAQATALQIGSETSSQYAALQNEIVAQLERGIPVTDAQRQAIVSLGQEDERYAIIQSKISEAIANRVNLSAELIKKIRDQADAQVNLNASREVDQLTEKASENLFRKFERDSEIITQSLTDALLRGFENGKSLAENFKDSLVNLFKTLVLRPVIEFIVKPLAEFAQQAIGSLLGGALGIGGGAGGGSSGGLGNLLGIGGAASGLLGAGATSFPGFAGQTIPTLSGIGGQLAGPATGGVGGMFGGITGALSSGGLLSSIVSGISTPRIGAQAAIIAQELFGSAFGKAAGGLASGIAGSIGSNVGFGAIGGIIANLAGIGKNADPTAKLLLSSGGGAAGAAGGAALGASFGTPFGGPIGAVIGSILGAALSSAIPATPPRGFESVSYDKQGRRIVNKAGKKGFDAGDLDPIVNTVTDSLTAVDKQLKLKLIKKNIEFFVGFNADSRGFRATVGGKDVDFGRGKDASGKVQGAIFKEELMASLPNTKRSKFQDAVLKRAFAPENDLLIEQLKSIQKDLGVKKRLKDFTKVVEFDPATEKTKELRKELRDLTHDFNALKNEAKDLGLNTKRAEEALKKTKRRKLDEIMGIEVERESTKISAQQQAFQLAGEELPKELQAAGVALQFKAIGIQFRELGLDTTVLDTLLAKALENIGNTVTEAATMQEDVANKLAARSQAFQLAGRDIPIDLQQAGLVLQFQQLGEQFLKLGLDASELSGLLGEAVQNLNDNIQLANKQKYVGALQQAYQTAGRTVPFSIQSIAIQTQFYELGQVFQQLGQDATILANLLQDALDNLEVQRRQAIVSAYDQAYQLAGKQTPIAIQRLGIELQFMLLAKQLQDLGQNAGELVGLLADSLANLEIAQQQARQSALERAFQLAGEDVPKEIQIAGVTSEFAALAKVFLDLGLDGSILGDLLQKAIEKINKAGEELKSGGFIGFIDELGRVTELDPSKRDIGSFGMMPANDSQFFGRREASPSVVEVNNHFHGPAVFDDITQTKFTRTVAKGLESRRARFG